MKINGKAPQATVDPAGDIAKALYMANFEPGDAAWDELDPNEREGLTALAEAYIGAHAQWQHDHGFRMASPGAVLRPTSQDEALAMVQAAKDFFDGQKRKGKLMGAVAPKKLILPKGMH